MERTIWIKLQKWAFVLQDHWNLEFELRRSLHFHMESCLNSSAKLDFLTPGPLKYLILAETVLTCSWRELLKIICKSDLPCSRTIGIFDFSWDGPYIFIERTTWINFPYSYGENYLKFIPWERALATSLLSFTCFGKMPGNKSHSMGAAIFNDLAVFELFWKSAG